MKNDIFLNIWSLTAGAIILSNSMYLEHGDLDTEKKSHLPKRFIILQEAHFGSC